MKKKLPITIIILYAIAFVASILVTVYLPASIYDDQKLIVKDFNSANKINYRKSTHDKITTITCGKMTGMDTIWTDQVDEDINLQMDYIFEVSSGKAKLVLINPDDTIITLVEQDSVTAEEDRAKELAELNLKKGKNRIKIICKKGTTFSLSYKMIKE